MIHLNYSKRPGKQIKKIGILENIKNPVISIITPFYNGGKTLWETANSIFSQTYPFFEWIIIDDGSTDKDSLEKLEELEKFDSRVRILHKENGGPAQARDFGILKSSESSKYIYFLDCDDIIENTTLELMYWTLETHKEASLVYPSIINFGDLEYYWEPYFSLEEEVVNNVMCISTMIRKEDLLEVGCFGIKEKAMYEDWNLWLKLLAKGKIPIRINAPVFWYRVSKTGEFARANKNHDKAMKLINSTVKTIKKDVTAIQYPKFSENVPTKNSLGDMVLPKYKKDKDTILFILPEMIVSNRNIFDFEFIKRLSNNGYNCIVITTNPVRNNLRYDLEDYTTEFYDLTNFLDFKDYPLFIDYLINSRCVSTIFVDNSEFGYATLPYIKEKNPNLKIVDYINEGDLNGDIINYSKELNSIIDTTLTTTDDLSTKINKDNIRFIGKEDNKVNRNSKKYNVDKLKEKYNIPKDKKIISFIDRISYDERPELFLKIASALSKQRNDVSFIISGSGPMYDDIKMNISKLKLDKNIYLFERMEDNSELYLISDLVINCSLKDRVSISPYKALSLGTPVIVSNFGKQSELVNENIGKVVLISPDKINSNEEFIEYVNSSNIILDNLDQYKRNVKQKMSEQSSRLDSIYNDFIQELNSIKIKKCPNNEFSLLVYSYYLEKIKPMFKEKYTKYYEENLYITIKEKPDTGKLSHIKKKFRTISIKYKIENETQYIFNTMKNCYKVCKHFYICIRELIVLIIRIIPTIWNFIKIIIRLIKVCLVKVKRKIIK